MAEDSTVDVEAAQEADTDTPQAPEQTAETAPEAFDAERAQEKIRKANSEAASLRKRLKEYEPIIVEAQKAKDAQKSETQKLQDRLQEAEQRAAEATSNATRLFAAAEFNIPADLIPLLGTGDEDAIRANAKLLAEKLKPAEPDPQPANTRPVESLRPGAAPAAQRDSKDVNSWLRQMAGRE